MCGFIKMANRVMKKTFHFRYLDDGRRLADSYAWGGRMIISFDLDIELRVVIAKSGLGCSNE